MKTGLIITAVILLVVGAALVAVALITSGFNFSGIGNAETETVEHVTENGFEKIDIASKESDIIIRRSEDGRTRVVCVEREKVKHSVSAENGTLAIKAQDNRGLLDRFGLLPAKLSVTVYLPGERYEALTVDGGTGNVSVPDGFSFGAAELKTSTGKVEYSADTDGDLRITASTGSVTVRDIRAGSVTVSVSTGSVTASSVTAKNAFQVTVSTGRTALDGVRCGELTTSGSTGDVTLRDTVVSGALRIERSTGDVKFEKSDAGSIYVKTSTGSVTGTLLSGKIFAAGSTTGSVSVPDTSSGGKCEIHTTTGKIKISLD